MPNSTGNKLLRSVKSHLHLNHESRHEKRTPAAAKPALPYNPYGLNNVTHKTHTAALSEDVVHPISLPNLNADVNDYLPAAFHQETINFEAKYQDIVQDYIANGGSAMVRRVRLKDQRNGQVFALKKFALFKTETLESYYRRTTSEFILMHSMHHLHVADVIEMVRLQLEIPRAWGMIMTNYPIDFYKVIRSPKWKYTPIEEKLCCFKQVCLGVKYIHEQDICHLDIKPDNILITRHGVLKITDFGCSVIGHEVHGDFNSPVQKYQKLLGTPPYQAPEVTYYTGISKSERKSYCPFKFDYFSLGVLLFVIIVGKTPFLNSVEWDSNFKTFTKDYSEYVETHPTFLQNDPNAIPRSTRSEFAHSHGYPGDWVRTWWRLCDPSTETRLTMRALFKDEWFRSIGICIDELEYECNFIHHDHDSIPLSIKYGQESQTEKVHRHGGGIKSRSNTVSRHRGTSTSTLNSSSHDQKYNSLIPKDGESSSQEGFNRSRGNHTALHSMNFKNSNINKSHTVIPPAVPISSSASEFSICRNQVEHHTSTHCAPKLDELDSSEETGSSGPPRISLQSLQLQEANKSAHQLNSNVKQENGINAIFNFYYPDGETMHFDFTPETYADPSKFMVVDYQDVIDSVANTVSHEHCSIMEML